jgi:tetratricopeptide (TPR) repeat protein
MSHIHEALIRAQKERDALVLRYSGILSASKRKKRILSGRTIRCALPLIIVVFLTFFYNTWFDLTASKTRQTYEKNQRRFQSTPKGNGPAKPQEIVMGKQGEAFLADRQEPVLEKHQETDLKKAQETYNSARRLHKKGRLEEAMRLYKETLQLDPGYVDALNNLAVILISKRDYINAQRTLEKAVRLKPKYAEPFYNLACLNAIRGEIHLALEHLKRAISLDPNVKYWAPKDKDLENLQHLPEFKELI